MIRNTIIKYFIYFSNFDIPFTEIKLVQFEKILYIFISDIFLFINNFTVTFFSFLLNSKSSIKSNLLPSISILNLFLLFLTNVLLNNLILLD